MGTYIKRDLPNDEYQAAVGANNASATNVFATIDDLTSGIADADALVLDVKINQVGGINKGQAVYINGASGTNILIGKADYSTEATSSKTLGLVITSGANNTFTKVITQGRLTGTGTEPLDTSAAAAGDPVWLGDDGNLIYGLVNKPYAPNHLVFIGIVAEANPSVGEIEVKVQNGYKLDEIHDVDLITNPPVDQDVLTYDNASGLWINQALPAVQGENLNINLEPVIENTITDPSLLSPDFGDSYLVPIGATGAWLGQDNNIATWDSVQWQYYIPTTGDTTTVLTGINAGVVYNFDGLVWQVLSTTYTGATPFYLSGSNVDAGGNKTGNIARVGPITLGSNSGPYGSSPLTVRGTGSLENVVSRWGMGAGSLTGLNNWYRIAGFSLSNNTSKTYQILINIGGKNPNTWASATVHINISKVSGTGKATCRVVNISGPEYGGSLGDGNFRLDETNFDFRRYANAAGGTVNFRLYYKPTVANTFMSATVLNSAGGTTGAIGIQWFNNNIGAAIEGSAAGGSASNFATFSYAGQRTNISAIIDPTVTDDYNLQYTVGSLWYNTVTQKVFQCLDSSLGAAVWKQITNDPAVTLYNQQIEDESVTLTQRNVINFVGAGVTAADSGGKTVVTIPGGIPGGGIGPFTMMLGGAVYSGNQTGYFTNGGLVGLETTARLGVPAGTMVKTILYLSSNILGTASTVNVVKNGIVQDGTGGTVNTTLTIGAGISGTLSASYSLSLIATDAVSLRIVLGGTGGQTAGVRSALLI